MPRTLLHDAGRGAEMKRRVQAVRRRSVDVHRCVIARPRTVVSVTRAPSRRHAAVAAGAPRGRTRGSHENAPNGSGCFWGCGPPTALGVDLHRPALRQPVQGCIVGQGSCPSARGSAREGMPKAARRSLRDAAAVTGRMWGARLGSGATRATFWEERWGRETRITNPGKTPNSPNPHNRRRSSTIIALRTSRR
jgi:hypothetical protein